MKYLLFLFAIASLIACQKETPPTKIDPPPHQPIVELGKVVMDRDGQPWIATFTAHFNQYPSTSSFGFFTKTYSGGIEEILSFGDIPTKVGKFSMENGIDPSTWGNNVPDAGIGWLLDGDQFLGSLVTDTSYQSNFVEVTYYDSIEHIAEGRFQVHLIKPTVSSNYLEPDSMVLTNGKFNLKIAE